MTHLPTTDPTGKRQGALYVETDHSGPAIGRGLYVHATWPAFQDGSCYVSEADGRALLKYLAEHFAKVDTADAKKAAAEKKKAAEAHRASLTVGTRVRYTGARKGAAYGGPKVGMTGKVVQTDGFGEASIRVEFEDLSTVGGSWGCYPENLEILAPEPLKPFFAVGDRAVFHGPGRAGIGRVSSVGPSEHPASGGFFYWLTPESGDSDALRAAFETGLGEVETPAPDPKPTFAVGDRVRLTKASDPSWIGVEGVVTEILPTGSSRLGDMIHVACQKPSGATVWDKVDLNGQRVPGLRMYADSWAKV